MEETTRKLCAAIIAGDVINRFWEKVARDDSPDGCWNWQASGRGVGYGAIKIAGVVHDAHRLAWVIAFGDIHDGLYVCHRCDNRKCCRPSHLFLGTAKDNAQDMVAKGRHPHVCGEAHHSAKLKEAQVIELLGQIARGGKSLRAIARENGVNHKVINNIASGHCWKHVPRPEGWSR